MKTSCSPVPFRHVAPWAALLPMIAACGGNALTAADGPQAPASSSDSAAIDGLADHFSAEAVDDAAMADALSWDLHNARTLVGTMAFNEPMNDGYAKDITPTWSSDGMTISSSGHLTGSITTTFVGIAPTADEHKDVLFWSVVGDYPEEGDAQSIALSETVGVVSSSTSDDGSAVFALDGAFDPTIRGAEGARLFEIDVGLTWVRVYRKSGVLLYQVLPGWRQAFEPVHQLVWDETATGLNGPFGDYAPLPDGPALGMAFDYPSWIRAHVVW